MFRTVFLPSVVVLTASQTALGQWSEFQDETASRFVLTTIPLNDGEEKDTVLDPRLPHGDLP